jgi:hypothetical protein
MRRLQKILAIAISVFVTAGLFYSAVCDTSCAIVGCAPQAKSSSSESNDPHAHCRAKKARAEGTSTSHSSISSAANSGTHKQNPIPECETHFAASALMPSVSAGSAASLHAFSLDQAEPVVFDKRRLSQEPFGSQMQAHFRSPPPLRNLTQLRI